MGPDLELVEYTTKIGVELTTDEAPSRTSPASRWPRR